jgi:hypothetical protein
VYKEAGYPFRGGDKGWRLTTTRRVRNWFKANSTYVARGQADWQRFTPTPGDYVYIGRAGDPDRKHSGIVERLDADGDLHTIEGNNWGRPVARYVYPNFRTNSTDNGPANGIVLGMGLRCGKRIRIPNGKSRASSSGNNREPRNAFDGKDSTWWRNRTKQSGRQYLEMSWKHRKRITKISLRFGKHYPRAYRFRFLTGQVPVEPHGGWQWSTRIGNNDRRSRAHVWFRPVKNVWAVRIYGLEYSDDDYFSIMEMKIQR